MPVDWGEGLDMPFDAIIGAKWKLPVGLIYVDEAGKAHVLGAFDADGAFYRRNARAKDIVWGMISDLQERYSG